MINCNYKGWAFTIKQVSMVGEHDVTHIDLENLTLAGGFVSDTEDLTWLLDKAAAQASKLRLRVQKV